MENKPNWYPSAPSFIVSLPSVVRGKSRNLPCKCGSGEKAKKCSVCHHRYNQPISDIKYFQEIEKVIKNPNVSKMRNWFNAGVPVEDACVLMQEYVEYEKQQEILRKKQEEQPANFNRKNSLFRHQGLLVAMALLAGGI